MAKKTLTLTGLMAKPDAFGRLRLNLVDALAAAGGKPDNTWRRLRAVAPPARRDAASLRGGPKAPFKLPFVMHNGGAPDSAGLRGECWVSVPKDRREKILALAGELRSKEVELTAVVRRYSFTPPGGLAPVVGISLSLAGGPVELTK